MERTKKETYKSILKTRPEKFIFYIPPSTPETDALLGRRIYIKRNTESFRTTAKPGNPSNFNMHTSHGWALLTVTASNKGCGEYRTHLMASQLNCKRLHILDLCVQAKWKVAYA